MYHANGMAAHTGKPATHLFQAETGHDAIVAGACIHVKMSLSHARVTCPNRYSSKSTAGGCILICLSFTIRRIDRFNRHQTRNNTKITIINFILSHNAIWLQPELDLIFGFDLGGGRFKICYLNRPETITI